MSANGICLKQSERKRERIICKLKYGLFLNPYPISRLPDMAGTQDMAGAVMNGLFNALAHFYFPEASRRGPLVLCVEGEEVKVQRRQWE